jgi:hypothetical protein
VPPCRSHVNNVNTKDNIMDISKVHAAIAAARSAITAVVDAEIKARSFNGLKGLASVDTSLTRAEERLARVSQPKSKKSKKSKKSAAAATA